MHVRVIATEKSDLVVRLALEAMVSLASVALLVLPAVTRSAKIRELYDEPRTFGRA